MGFWDKVKQNAHFAGEKRQCTLCLQQVLMMLEDEAYANFTTAEAASFCKELKIAYTNFAYRVQEYKFTSLTIKDKEYNVKEYDAIIQTKIRYIYKNMVSLTQGLSSKFLCLFGILICSCQSKQQATEAVSSIDTTLQTSATAILESKLSELNAQSGQVIVMEVQSGQIKALVGLERKDNADYQPCENFSVQQPTGLMQGVSLLAALETGKVKMSDRVNAGNGIYVCKGDTVFDHNWHRGGYGEITVKQGLASGSNIATVKTMENAFGNNAQAYFDVLSK